MRFEAPQALLLAIPLALLVWRLGVPRSPRAATQSRSEGPASWLRWVPLAALALARPVLSRGGDAVDLVSIYDPADTTVPSPTSQLDGAENIAMPGRDPMGCRRSRRCTRT